MRQFLIPIILLIAAVGLFVAYTNPTYQSAKKTQVQVAAYNDALDKSQELRTIRDEKTDIFKNLSQDGKDRLLRILPDNVDNIHLIIDINSIAARHGLSLKNVTLGTISDSATTRNTLSVGASGSAVGSVVMGFSLSASYDNMLAFLEDLQHSLRVMDVEKIAFTAQDKDLSDFDFSIRTYWLH
jgi:Tfp pilus assembly protein PilO